MKLKLTLVFLFAFMAFTHNLFAQDKNAPFEKVEIEASFPGGMEAWNKYITKQLLMHSDEFKKKDAGTCNIQFIVDKNGRVQDVQATNMKKSNLAKFAIEAIENGPKWIPAQQGGKTVNAYRMQPVTLGR
ncbi:MAG: energy transducer TonB [Ginsengibacter sp.]